MKKLVSLVLVSVFVLGLVGTSLALPRYAVQTNKRIMRPVRKTVSPMKLHYSVRVVKNIVGQSPLSPPLGVEGVQGVFYIVNTEGKAIYAITTNGNGNASFNVPVTEQLLGITKNINTSGCVAGPGWYVNFSPNQLTEINLSDASAAQLFSQYLIKKKTNDMLEGG